MLFAICLVMIGLFVLLGTVFSLGKGAFLIADYSTPSAAERTNYDAKKLCKAYS